MNPYDSEKAARVWQRVHAGGNEDPTAEILKTLMLQLLQLHATYRSLISQVHAPRAALLRSLADRKRNQAACLRGIHILTMGSCPEPQVPQPKTESAVFTLRRCYAAENQLYAKLQSFAADATHGPAFAALATEQRFCCKTICELISQLER